MYSEILWRVLSLENIAATAASEVIRLDCRTINRI